MISIHTKSGTMKGNSSIVTILKSQKFKWTKSHKIDDSILPENSFKKNITLDAFNILFSLKHIKPKYRKKKIIVYTDSVHILSSLKTKNGEFINKTKLKIIDDLRDVVGTFNNLIIKNTPKKSSYVDELEHMFIECALDDIEINEKE